MEDHQYTSTACMHELHDRCRKNCKYCGNGCLCECHRAAEAQEWGKQFEAMGREPERS